MNQTDLDSKIPTLEFISYDRQSFDPSEAQFPYL